MQVIKVRLRKPRRVLSFLCGDGFLIDRDEACLVQSDHGPEWGVCVLPPEMCPADMEHHYPMRLLRSANANDQKTLDTMVVLERKAREICQDKIRRRSLPMKLVDVEYSFDQRKVVFFFTADERVDFRELVRDLAHELRVRIELRHIQVRDEAKLAGGLGSCGRMLCCATFLNDFKPISMRMAKRQNLSLNPAKISGQCGRLLCCLGYEFDQYETTRKKSASTPKPQPAPEPEDEEEPVHAVAGSVAPDVEDAEGEDGEQDASGPQQEGSASRKRRRRRKKNRPGGNGA